MRSATRAIVRTVSASLLMAQAGFAAAEPGADAQATAARVAAEGLAIGSDAGAGGDPQTSVAQPVFSAGRAAEVTTSFRPLLGPAGDPGGYRAYLESRGITFGLIAVAESYTNLRGGLRRGSTGLTLLDLDVDVDLDTFAGWTGAAVHATVYQIQGSGASRSRVGNLMTVSEIEALPASRLSELWLEQSLFDGQLLLRLGELSADTEYMVSQTSILFTNGTFGWPAIFAADMTDGGPAYPLSAPSVRLKFVPSREVSVQASLIDGTPGGGRPASGIDPQRRNPNGVRFPVSDPPLAIAEVSYAYNTHPGAKGEPGTVTLGGWHRFGRVDALTPDPVSGLGRRISGDSGIYGLIDQTFYREPDDPNDGASVFLRASASPGDRNLVDVYLDGGIAYRGLLPGRSDDTLGFAAGFTHISSAARRLDRIAAAQSSSPYPRRNAETVLEATYQVVLGPGVAVQPTLQYVMHPGGGIANPRAPDGARACATPPCSACAPSPAIDGARSFRTDRFPRPPRYFAGGGRDRGGRSGQGWPGRTVICLRPRLDPAQGWSGAQNPAFRRRWRKPGHVCRERTMRTIDNELEDFVLNGWSVLLGAGLASAPWYLGFASETAAALNAWAFGATVAAVATLALMRTYEWEVYAVGCAGLWACAAPWVLGFQEAIAAAGAHMGFGLLLVVSAGCQLWRLRDAPAAYET